MGDNPRRFQDYALKIIGGVQKNLLYMHYQIFKKGHNSVRKELINRSSLRVQLRTMGDKPRKFQDQPQKTVEEVVFTRICYILITKYLKRDITLLGKDE